MHIVYYRCSILFQFYGLNTCFKIWPRLLPQVKHKQSRIILCTTCRQDQRPTSLLINKSIKFVQLYLQCWLTSFYFYFKKDIQRKRIVFNVNKNPTDATVCRYLFTAKLLYMFRVSQHPSSGVLKLYPQPPVQVVWPVPEAAGTVFNTPDDGCCDTRNMQSSWVKRNQLDATCFIIIYSVLNMFRTSICPSSGACD